MVNTVKETLNLPFKRSSFEEQNGVIRCAEERYPGVYFVRTGVSRRSLLFSAEYILVMRSSPVVSSKVMHYGEALPFAEAVVFHNDNYFDRGRHVINYEISRYLTNHGLPLPEGETLIEEEARGMEVCPECFNIAAPS